MHSDAELFDRARRIGERLLASGHRAVTAESCTGGWVAKALTDVAGSSGWFDGGFVTYANGAKIRDLAVAPATLEAHGAVSEPVVREMALGALDRTGADVAVAVSGIAGPGGGSPGKPVGTVCFALARRAGAGAGAGAGTIVARTENFAGDREAVRRQAVACALDLLLTD